MSLFQLEQNKQVVIQTSSPIFLHSLFLFIYLFIYFSSNLSLSPLLVLFFFFTDSVYLLVFSQLNFVFQIHTTPFSNKHVITPLLVRRIWY